MGRTSMQFRLVGMIGLVAALAVNFWLFRIGILWGILGLNVLKHVATAFLCHQMGVDRQRS